MRKSILVTGIVLLAGIIFIVAGCGSKDSNPVKGNSGVPLVLKVTPSDGTTDIPRSSGIAVKFNMPMDTMSVREALFLSGGDSMLIWMDSLGQHMMMGNMTDMADMMNRMDSIMDSGSLEWNTHRDSCFFSPDSVLAPNSQYMILMYGSIKGSNGMMMDMEMGGKTSNYEMYHFRTGQ
jgi:hypothetical protein